MMVCSLLCVQSLLFGLQYVGLAFNMYEQYDSHAAALLALTITSGFLSTRRLYQKRLQLYRAVAQVNFVPLVQGEYVRYPALSLCMSVHPVSTAVCEAYVIPS